MDTGEPITPWVASFTQNLEKVGTDHHGVSKPARQDDRAPKPPTRSPDSSYTSLQSAAGAPHHRNSWTLQQQHLSRFQATHHYSTNSLPVPSKGSASIISNTLPPQDRRTGVPPRIVVSGPSPTTAVAQQSPLVLTAINNSKLMSLRKWILWVIGLREIHQYQSIHYGQFEPKTSSTASAVEVLRDLQELWKMYTPGRVMLPTEEVREVVLTIYDILSKQKLEAEEAFEEIDRNSRSMTSLEFMDWLSFNCRVAGGRFRLPVAGIFYNPDSLTDQHKEIDRAILYYSPNNSDIMHDTSATNTFSDVIVSALKSHQARLLPGRRDIAQQSAGPRSDWQMLYDIWSTHKQKKDEAEKASRTPQPAAASSSSRSLGDRLLFSHALPSPRK